jgi:hypothetical protein
MNHMSTDCHIIPTPIELPVRHWWLKRLSLGIGCLFIVFGAVYAVWLHESHRRWDVLAARPIPKEEPQPVIPDALNAATYLAAANAASPTQWIQTETLVANLAPSRKNIAPGGAHTLALARTARFQPYLRWPAGSTSLMTAMASHLAVAAVHAHANGNDAEAMEYLLDLVASTGRPDAPLPGGMELDQAIRHTMRFGNETIYLLALDLNVMPPSAPATQPGGPASRAQVQALIDALLDDSLFDRQFAQRLRVSAAVPWWNPQVSTKRGWLLGPLQRLVVARICSDLDGAATQIQAGEHRTVLNGLQNPGFERTAAGTLIRPYEQLMWNIIAGHYQALTERRVAAIALGVRLYALDHAGNVPNSLEALVPSYLKTIPEDPFADGSRPLLYVASPQPAVMSVGPNGVDDGTLPARAAAAGPLPRTLVDQEHWFNEDAVYLLPVVPVAATKAASQSSSISPPASPE